MKQGTIAFLILLEAALVLGLVYHAVGGYRAIVGETGLHNAQSGEIAGAARTTEGTEISQPSEGQSGETSVENPADDGEALPEGTEWGILSQEDYLCDENGRLAEYRCYEYDRSGNLVRVTYYQTPGEWSEEYRYDDQGKMISCVRTDASPEGTQSERIFSYEEDRLVRIGFYESGKLITFQDFLYDEEGRLWREVTYRREFIPMQMETQSRTVSENGTAEAASASGNGAGAEVASASGNEDGAEAASASGNGAGTEAASASENVTETAGEEEPDPVLYTIREHRYDAEGNEIRNWQFFADGKIAGPWEEYEYDEEGRMISLIHRDSDGTLSAREDYTYYSEDKVSSVISTNGDGSIRWRHYRDYDAQGKLIHEEVRDEETLVTWHLYIYDEDGRLLEMHDNAGGLYYIYDEDTGLLTATERHAEAGAAASEDNLTGRTVYRYQPVPIGTAVLPEQ